MPAAAPITLADVTIAYDRHPAVHHLSGCFAAGSLTAIVGPNGAGKTTLLRAICGMSMVEARGSVRLDGIEVRGKRPDQLLRAGVAHVPQGRGTLTDLTVEDNLRVGGYIRSDAKQVEADIQTWFEVFPRLGERRDQVAGSMSGGEQQMLAIARAFMSQPRLLLLDEPSLGLAPLITQELFDRLHDVTADRGTSVLLVEQNANLSLDFAARAYVLEAGSVVTSGPAAQLKADEAIQKAYLGI